MEAPPDFDLADGMAVLRRTPGVLRTLLAGLSDGWTRADEGPDTWSPFDVVGHLIDGEETDWMAHDLGHIAQIARVMAKRYREAVGPWEAYLPVLHR